MPAILSLGQGASFTEAADTVVSAYMYMWSEEGSERVHRVQYIHCIQKWELRL